LIGLDLFFFQESPKTDNMNREELKHQKMAHTFSKSTGVLTDPSFATTVPLFGHRPLRANTRLGSHQTTLPEYPCTFRKKCVPSFDV
jgi:hypothetical protein